MAFTKLSAFLRYIPWPRVFSCQCQNAGDDNDWSQLRRGWERVQQAHRRCQLAQEHGWFLCLPELQAELLAALTSLADVITSLRASYQLARMQELTQSHWYQEVVQLHDEFPAVTFLKE